MFDVDACVFCFIFCVGTDFMDWTLERVYITII